MTSNVRKIPMVKEISGHGGWRPGAGRKAGSKNKPQYEVPEQRARYAAADTPLKYMLAVMRDPFADTKRRDKAAKAAAPYCHTKQAAEKATNEP